MSHSKGTNFVVCFFLDGEHFSTDSLVTKERAVELVQILHAMNPAIEATIVDDRRVGDHGMHTR